MNVFVRAVVTGFGFSLGAALFRKVQSRLGLSDKQAKNGSTDGRVDPGVVAGRSDGPGEGEAKGICQADTQSIFG